jgi:hypothetical protein
VQKDGKGEKEGEIRNEFEGREEALTACSQ